MMRLIIISIIAYAFVILVNILANLLPLNNLTTGEISDLLPVLITPAGYVFSIWGLIYVLLFIWLYRRLTEKIKQNVQLFDSTIYYVFILSCVFNMLWIFLWHYLYFIQTIFAMIGLLITLIILYKRVRASASAKDLLDTLPFSIYLGWISVATIVNMSYVLVYIEWERWGLSAEAWTFMMLFVATLLAFIFLKTERDTAYALVFVWAFIGIAIKNQGDFSMISLTAYVLAAILLITVIFRLERNMIIFNYRK